MKRATRWVWFAVGAFLACGIGWLLLVYLATADMGGSWPQTQARQSEAAQDAGPTNVAKTVAPPANTTPPSPNPRVAAPATRIELVPPPAKANESHDEVPLPNTMLRDRRDQPGPHAKQERVAVGYALDTLDEDIEQCLDQWRKTQVSLQGSLTLGIELDAKGVQKAWVASDAGIPLGPQSCFSNAVYGIDWSNMVDSPAMITRPYSFDRDGGA